MIERIRTGMNGKQVIELIPETEADLARLESLDREGLLDTRQSFGDGPFDLATPVSTTNR